MEQPKGSNLRKGRYSESGRIYLLTTTTHDRKPVFADFASARICIGALKFQQDKGLADSLAFVVMPDHIHWLCALQQGDLARVMQSFKRHTARQINRFNCHRGALWQAGYHDHAVRQAEDLRQIARYVIENPVRAGLVERICDYPHWDADWIA